MDLTSIFLCLLVVVCYTNAVTLYSRDIPAGTEGEVRLVGSTNNNEGNVIIYHFTDDPSTGGRVGFWGILCDDSWELKDASLVCKQLGFPDGATAATVKNKFDATMDRIWMDDIYCYGHETQISECSHYGWGRHNCEMHEAAGVICKGNQEATINPLPTTTTTEPPLPATFPLQPDVPPQPSVQGDEALQTGGALLLSDYDIRLRGGRRHDEGRVEIRLNGEWGVICGQGWTLRETHVVCKALGLGYGRNAVNVNYFGGDGMTKHFGHIECAGHESALSECNHFEFMEDPNTGGPIKCGRNEFVAGVHCATALPDIYMNLTSLQRSAYLQDRPLAYLECAMEEDCLPPAAYTLRENNINWHQFYRRLLRFSSDVYNNGTADFRPFAPRESWEWHDCHMHYHSMQVFSHYDILHYNGSRVAEGHKAGFCLEDVVCDPGVRKNYQCVGGGPQGISPGCADIYDREIDCQWIDITDVKPGQYLLRIHLNPQWLVGESNYENNVALCDLTYDSTRVRLTHCTHEHGYYTLPDSQEGVPPGETIQAAHGRTLRSARRIRPVRGINPLSVAKN